MKQEITKEEAIRLLEKAHLHPVLPYRGYAVTVSDDGKRRIWIGHSPEGKIELNNTPSTYDQP